MKFYSPEDFADGLDQRSAQFAADKANLIFRQEAFKATGNLYTFGRTYEKDKWALENFSTKPSESDTHVCYLVRPRELGSFDLPERGDYVDLGAKPMSVPPPPQQQTQQPLWGQKQDVSAETIEKIVKRVLSEVRNDIR